MQRKEMQMKRQRGTTANVYLPADIAAVVRNRATAADRAFSREVVRLLRQALQQERDNMQRQEQPQTPPVVQTAKFGELQQAELEVAE
jgi:hypothetical protein